MDATRMPLREASLPVMLYAEDSIDALRQMFADLADFLVDASLRPGVSEGALLVDAGLVAPGGISPAAQRGLVMNVVDYIIQQARESDA